MRNSNSIKNRLQVVMTATVTALAIGHAADASSIGLQGTAANTNSSFGLNSPYSPDHVTGHSFTFIYTNSGNWEIGHFAVRVVDASMGGYDNNTLSWPAISASGSGSDAFKNIQTASTAGQYAMFSASPSSLQNSSAPTSIKIAFDSSHADGGGTAFDIAIFDVSGTLVQSSRVTVPYGSTLASEHIIDFTGENLGDAYWQPDFNDIQALVIPLPAPVWMGLVGLAGVVVLRRRHFKA